MLFFSISYVEALINICFFRLHFLCFFKHIKDDFSRAPLELLGLIFQFVDCVLHEGGEELFSVELEGSEFFIIVQMKPVKTINCNW